MMLSNSLHILCFGDSLTAGFTLTGNSIHPYKDQMERTLQKAFPTWNITTDLQGVSGDQVHSPPGGFVPRMEILYDKTHPTHSYTHAVILGGTNDLVTGRSASSIYKALKQVWAIPLSHNTKVLALTIPECPACWNTVEPERRDRLNKAILEREAENYYTMDLYSKIPFMSMPEKRRKEIWDDGVHFTHKGYDVMGRLIGERLVEILKVELEEEFEMVENGEDAEEGEEKGRNEVESGRGELRKRREGEGDVYK